MYPQNNLGQLGFDPATLTAVGVTLFNVAKNIFGQQISPEAQAEKAGVWGAMLTEFLGNPNMTSRQLADKWYANFPFKQQSTKNSMRNSMSNWTREETINSLVRKINDELRKGGMPTVTRQELEANFRSGNSSFISQQDIAPNFPGENQYGLPQSNQYSTYDQYPGVQQASMMPGGMDNKTMLIAGGILAAGALGYYLFKK
jgi:hypothetical protein